MSWNLRDRGIIILVSTLIVVVFFVSMYFSLFNPDKVEPIVSQTSCPETKMSPQGLEYFRPKCMRPWIKRDLPRVSKKFHSLLDSRRLVDETTTRHAPNYTEMSLGIVPEDNRDIATCKTHYMVIHKDNLLHHFPHFANMYLPFFSLLIWQYDVLNISTQSHCLTSLLMDDENDRFWSADRSSHTWMYTLVSTIEKFFSVRTILSPQCLLDNYPKYHNYNKQNLHRFYSDVTSNFNYFPDYEEARKKEEDVKLDSHSGSVQGHTKPKQRTLRRDRNLIQEEEEEESVDFHSSLPPPPPPPSQETRPHAAIPPKLLKTNYMGSYLHASEGLLLSYLLMKRPADVCELSNRYQYLLNKPVNLLLLARQRSRDIFNQKEIVQSLLHYIHEHRTRKSNTEIYLPNKLNSTTKLIDYSPDLSFENKSLGIYFEDMNFQQQVTNFYQTDILVTMHGAGMTNLIFMKPCSIVIEITPFGFHSNALDAFTIQSDILHYGWQEDYDHTVYKKAYQARYYCEDVIKEMLSTSAEHQKGASVKTNEATNKANNKRHLSESSDVKKDWMLQGRQNRRLTGNKKHSKFLAPGETSNTRPDRLFPEFNAVYSDRCYEDSVCRSCTREVDGVTVSVEKLLRVLEVAMEDRKQCIMRHPFYNHYGIPS